MFGWRSSGKPAPGELDPRLIDQHARVVLPKEILEALRVKPGGHLHFTVLPDGRVEVRRVKLSLE